MSLADEIIAYQYGTPEIERLREAAKLGDPQALKVYVCFCIWQAIRHDAYIPVTKKAAVFRELVDQDLIEVALG